MMFFKAGNPFLNIALMGALRLWTPFAGVALENGAKNFGRKKLLIISQGLYFKSFDILIVMV
jgi:hypothetical protein